MSSTICIIRACARTTEDSKSRVNEQIDFINVRALLIVFNKMCYRYRRNEYRLPR